ncbi:hypothetical protein NQ176_g183 [Zarea fungicola]|uniref:Uncharacterized protein n=1 Tax=Zarea fungicola TaxID=93591 RepID=A0ACC1P060_9HYPO|nr:hypothetical protein NQ176_g183 [Lecanicillium fungicola]
MNFHFERLPPEVRQLIWEATLPERRVFHVSEISQANYTEDTDNPFMSNDTELDEQTFEFHIRHGPPMATQVCRESRAIALLRGFFLAPKKSLKKSSMTESSTGPWFNPQKDMLYLDRNMRHCLKAKLPLPVAGMDRVLHVGLEWRAWFRDVPRRPADEKPELSWITALEPLLLHCPRAETVAFVLPRVRRAGGVPSGREPYGAENYRCDLVQLPDNVTVPWDRPPLPSAGLAAFGVPGLALSQIVGQSVPTEWKVIRGQMEKAVNVLQGTETGDGDGDEYAHREIIQRRRPVHIRGWWLVRPGVPMSDEQQDIREFWT